MRNLFGALSLLGVIGCASTGPADAPPELEITSPTRGTISDGTEVTVTGTVSDDLDGVRVRINDVDAMINEDGTFTARVPVGSGISILESHAIDASGHDVRDVRAVLAGKLVPSDGTRAAQVGAQLGVDALATIGEAVATGAEAVDLTAAILPLNPVYNNTGCLGARVDITSVDLSNVDVSFVPRAGALGISVELADVEIHLASTFKVACLGGATNIVVTIPRAQVSGDLGLAAASGTLVATLPTATVVLEGFDVDVGGVPDAIVGLLEGYARNAAIKAIQKIIVDKVPSLATSTIAGLVAQPYTGDVLGNPTKISVAPTAATISPDGLFVAFDTKLRVVGGEGGRYVSSPMPIAGALPAQPGFGVAVADDAVNSLFAGLWAAKALDLRIDVDAAGAAGNFLDASARTLEVSFALPPTVIADGDELALVIGDVMITARDERGTEVQKLALSLRSTIYAGLDPAGQLVLTTGTADVRAQVLTQSEQRGLDDKQYEAFLKGAWNLVGSQASKALAHLPLPTMAGITLGSPTVEARGGYLVAGIPLD